MKNEKLKIEVRFFTTLEDNDLKGRYLNLYYAAHCCVMINEEVYASSTKKFEGNAENAFSSEEVEFLKNKALQEYEREQEKRERFAFSFSFEDELKSLSSNKEEVIAEESVDGLYSMEETINNIVSSERRNVENVISLLKEFGHFEKAKLLKEGLSNYLTEVRKIFEGNSNEKIPDYVLVYIGVSTLGKFYYIGDEKYFKERVMKSDLSKYIKEVKFNSEIEFEEVIFKDIKELINDVREIYDKNGWEVF